MKIYQVLAVIQLLVWSGARGALDIAVEEPIEVMQSNAAAGDPSAQYNLALAFQEGRGVPKHLVRAVEWYRKAAAAGFSEAQYNLGVLLINGGDVRRDEKEAARWFYAAAQNGFYDAQKMMVKLYTAGRGVEKSPARALAWDILARRTLELRFGVAAGLPPKPGALRADGAAEVIGKGGTKEWIRPDGGRETIDAAGVRHIEYQDGRKTTVQTDGAWDTLYPNGLTEQMTAEGRKTLRDAKGQTEITEPDGSRIEEGTGTGSSGNKVQIRDTFSPDGKRISHRVTDGGQVYEERADGTRLVETKVKRDDGVEMILAEEVSADGTQGKGKLRRADNGAGPKDAEIWAIRRKLKLRGGATLEVIEKYSSAGFYSQEEAKQVAEAKTPSARTPSPAATPTQPIMVTRMISTPQMVAQPPMQVANPPMVPLPPQIVRTIGTTGFEDPSAFASKPDIRPMLRELEEIETGAHNFAGATEAEYQQARATAAAYVIPLAVPPQKAVNAPAWLREKAITQTTLHEAPLLPILDDRSKLIPFGPHGAEIIKQSAWKHAETDHFIIHYLGETEARLTVQYIEGVYTVLTQLLNLDPQRGAAKSHVFVFPENDWKTYLTAKNHPPQLAGFAYKTELLMGAPTDRENRTESIKVLCHEVTHALVARFYPGCRSPLWMNEGLAEYIALRTMRTKGVALISKTRDDKAAGNQPKTRDEMEARLVGKPDPDMDVARLFTRVRYGSRTSPDRMAAFYANSQKCVRVLFEKLPVEGFSKFFNCLTAGNQPDVALANAFGKQCSSVPAFQLLVNGS